jgi:hypothetical protein
MENFTTELEKQCLIVKIRRNSERFFVKICRVTRTHIYAEVDSHVICQPFKHGDIITIEQEEIMEIYD